MDIALVPPPGQELRDDSPWRALATGLNESGHTVVLNPLSAERLDALVTMNDQPIARRIQRRFSLGPQFSALVALEPQVTAPKMYTADTIRRYNLKYAASHVWARDLNAQPFRWPQIFVPRPKVPVRRTFDAVLVNSEKRSAVSGSLYGLRRRTVNTFDEQGINLGVYGHGWRQPRLKRVFAGSVAIVRAGQSGRRPDLSEAFGQTSIRPLRWEGPVDYWNKQRVLSQAPVALVIENSSDYVSEKIFDAVSAGCAPIYVGPPLNEFGFPPEIALSCPPCPDALVDAFRSMREPRVRSFVVTGQDWLRSADAMGHEIRHVLTGLGREIGSALRIAKTRPR